ncbi:hypothetical protein RND81_08G123500 [Saponaria officinalis]|uniref:DUF7963 domain-containing protein n=1 Tax=Saponaria officinalis TaxID=3572 RepID=A0AAW1J6T7_SAPOF
MSAGGGAEEATVKAVEKRYDGLVNVRNKAVNGKGAWYWAHLLPLLVRNDETGLPKAVKLKCCLCDSIFSASNPSRTASEHLKRGTCPYFSSSGTALAVKVGSPKPQAEVTPPLPKYNHRKRNSSSSSSAGGIAAGVGNTNTNNTTNTSTGVSVVVDPSRFSGSEMGCSGVGGALMVHPQYHTPHPNSHHLTPPDSSGWVGGDGGRDGLSDAKMFEDSIKQLKSPKTSHRPTLSKTQIECALDCLSEWVYESCGYVSFSSLEHPKFKAFLHQVGMNEVSKTDFFRSRLDSRFEVVRNESDARIKDAMFFQIASHGWKSELGGLDDHLVSISANFPNGTSVYRRAVFMSGQACGKLSEEVLWETIVDVCGNSMHQCVGIVADKFKSATLKNLESQYHWMINLSCQCHAFNILIKDFYSELPLFKNVADRCMKLANFVNNKTLRNCLHKYEIMEYGFSGLFRKPVKEQQFSSFEPVYVMIEDIISSARVLQLVLSEESYKIAAMEEPIAREFGEMVRDVGFWNDLEAVRSLVRLVKEMANDFETERPLVGQCLPLWDELRTKVKDWCAKFHVEEVLVEKVIEKRFRKNYHPAWAAAYVLDPFYTIRDPSGKYLPPFKFLSPEQQNDVHDLVTRLVSREQVPAAMSELTRWRSNGLDPVYAQAVQLKQRDPNSGKMRIANPQCSRLVWETYLPEFESLGKVALRLIFLHATARGFNCNTPILNWVRNHGRSKIALDKAQKMIFIAAHSKLERRDFSCEDDKDADLFASVNGEVDVFIDQ